MQRRQRGEELESFERARLGHLGPQITSNYFPRRGIEIVPAQFVLCISPERYILTKKQRNK